MVGWISILILGTIYQSRLLADTIASVRLVLTNDNESAEELDVLTAGEETDLNHGSGIGLWVVNWVVTRYGGELSFETPPEGGSLVRITLPAAEES